MRRVVEIFDSIQQKYNILGILNSLYTVCEVSDVAGSPNNDYAILSHC